jgi:hypothetical protein
MGMKKAILLILFSFSVLLPFVVYAQEERTPKITLKIANPVQDNTYFVCLPNIGCLSILAANRGKEFPLFGKDMANIRKIFILNRKTGTMSMQALDASCQIEIANNQMLILSGKLKLLNEKFSLTEMQCNIKNVS